MDEYIREFLGYAFTFLNIMSAITLSIIFVPIAFYCVYWVCSCITYFDFRVIEYVKRTKAEINLYFTGKILNYLGSNISKSTSLSTAEVKGKCLVIPYIYYGAEYNVWIPYDRRKKDKTTYILVNNDEEIDMKIQPGTQLLINQENINGTIRTKCTDGVNKWESVS
jgi:hypothetical protein